MRAVTMIVALAVLAVPGCRPKPQAGPKIDPALATMVPETAVGLAGVKIEAVRATEVYKRFAGGLDLSEFSRTTGLDLKTDVWELLFVYEPPGWVVMARGKFSPGFGGLEPRVLEGAPRTPYKGHTIIGDAQASVVFVNSSTAIAGEGGAVRGILDRRSQSRGIPPALDEQVRAIPPGSQIWIVAPPGLAGLPIPREGNWANLHRLGDSLEALWLAVDLRNGVELSASGSCASEEDAGKLHDTLRGILGLGRLSAPSDRADLLRLYDSIQIDRRQREVRLGAVVPLDLVEKLIPMIR